MVVLLLVAAALVGAVGGWALAPKSALTQADADAARHDAQQRAFRTARRKAATHNVSDAYKRGYALGTRQGQTHGYRDGLRDTLVPIRHARPRRGDRPPRVVPIGPRQLPTPQPRPGPARGGGKPPSGSNPTTSTPRPSPSDGHQAPNK